MKEFGRLCICELKELEAPKGSQPFEKYILVDENTRKDVYWSPYTPEGLEQIKSVRDAQLEKRERSAG